MYDISLVERIVTVKRKNSPAPLKDAKIRFWSNVRTAAPDLCWNFEGDQDGNGYGRVTIAGKKIRTHRFSYMIHHELTQEDMEDIVIRHTCDNPSCVNPNHLVPGTRLENNHDTIERGRNARGEKSPKSKLTAAQVVEIRALHANHSLNQSQIAQAYNVSPATINDLLLGKTWKHL